MTALAIRARAKILRVNPFYGDRPSDTAEMIVKQGNGLRYAHPPTGGYGLRQSYFGFSDGSVLVFKPQPPASTYFSAKYGERTEKRRAQLSWKAYNL